MPASNPTITNPSASPDPTGSPRARREPLTRERIVLAAMRIMDDEGLEAVTMRRVGRELGVEAMSLYNHVADKEDILGGVVEAVMGEFEFPPATDDWHEAGRRTARAWRDLLKAHPNVMTIMSHQRKPLASVAALRPTAYALDILGRAGLSEEETVRAFRAFGGYIQGFVLAEIVNMFGGDLPDIRPADIERTLPLDELPSLRGHLPYLFHCDFDAEFEYGLDLMLRGLEAKRAGAGPSA